MSPNFASDHAVDPHFDLEKDFQRVWVKGHLPADGLELSVHAQRLLRRLRSRL